MAQGEDMLLGDDVDPEPAPGRSRGWLIWLRRVLLGLLILLLAAVAYVWFTREDIADDLIQDELDQLDLQATYDIESIGPERQVLSNVVVGDPAAPDLTIQRVTINLRYRFGTPVIGRVTVDRARLFGSYKAGVLSFGALDSLIFTDSDEPPSLPDLDVALIDGRALLETDYGPIAFKANGEGELDDGFVGQIAAVAPEFDAGTCMASDASAYGTIEIDGGKPEFSGPLRAARFSCPGNDLALRDIAVQLTAASDAAFETYSGTGRLTTGALAVAGNGASGLTGTLRANWRNDTLDSTYNLAARSVGTGGVGAALVTAEGALRSRDNFAQTDVTADIEGNGVRLGEVIDQTLASFTATADETLAAPLLTKVRAALKREARGSRLVAQLNLKQTGEITTLVIPQANLRGGSGATLLALSKVQMNTAGSGFPRLSGNIATGGAGLPTITGRMERRGNGEALFRLQMANYEAEGNSLAIPELLLIQSPAGAIGFSGRAAASGVLPGGSATNLRLPLSGSYSAAAGLALWRKCTDIQFDRLELANLVFEQRGINVCPVDGRSILTNNSAGLQIAAGTPSLDLQGTIAETPISIASGPVGFAYPGAISAADLNIVLGADDSPNRFTIANLDAQIGEEISGSFSEADISLFAAPHDFINTSGNWTYREDRLELTDGAFIFRDRTDPARFKALVSRDATLTLEESIITAAAVLREPTSDREVALVDVAHNLETSIGGADLAVSGLRFDERLQPEQLSELALGVVANADGVITGTGRIDWGAEDVTSSGVFSSESFDFAAAFGPVQGASGTVTFTDLINLTTEPNQRLKVASINPGIEVLDGELEFSLRDSQFLSVAGGTWPFMGGTLELKPVEVNFTASETRAYILEITGLDAAQFVSQMELGNLSATGTFDGTIPIIFDEMGNGRIEGGLLLARDPGGNISYVGQLTYEDMTPIVNFAFSALRSLDYKEMELAMDGSLTGEIVTRVRFDGVRQGEGASNNFITKQIANLPIRMNVNVRAPFYQLITSMKAMYDPAFVRDPRELGLISDEAPIQNPESEPVP